MYDIWIDIANAPRVPFFKSLLSDLCDYSIFITTSPRTNELMKRFDRDKSSFGVLSQDDPLPIFGSMAQSLDFLLDEEKRKMVFR